MQPGVSFYVFSLARADRSAPTDMALEEAVKRRAIKIIYKSMYDEQFTVEWPHGKGLALDETLRRRGSSFELQPNRQSEPGKLG